MKAAKKPLRPARPGDADGSHELPAPSAHDPVFGVKGLWKVQASRSPVGEEKKGRKVRIYLYLFSVE